MAGHRGRDPRARSAFVAQSPDYPNDTAANGAANGVERSCRSEGTQRMYDELSTVELAQQYGMDGVWAACGWGTCEAATVWSLSATTRGDRGRCRWGSYGRSARGVAGPDGGELRGTPRRDLDGCFGWLLTKWVGTCHGGDACGFAVVVSAGRA